MDQKEINMSINRDERKKPSITVADYPRLKAEWDYSKNGRRTPDTVPAYSNRKAYWVCDRGHEWEAKISNRANGNGCPFCSGRRSIKGETDLATVCSEVAKEWDYSKNGTITPDTVSAHSGIKAHWVCDRGHEWEAAIYARTNGSGCPFCSGRRPTKGKTDLATVCPEVAKAWDYSKNGTITPDTVSAYSDIKAHWVCDRGHKWESMIINRAKGKGCPCCAGKKRAVFANE